MSALANQFLTAAPWLLGLWLLAVGVLLLWRPSVRAGRRGAGRWARVAAGVGLMMVLGAGLLGGSLVAHSAPPVPEVVPVRTTRPDGTMAPPASDSPNERVVPVVPAGPRRISC
jgi:hypothetical protein